MALIKQRGQPVPMKIEEVDHVAMDHPVNHVADGATQDQRKRKAKQGLIGMSSQ